MSKVKPSWRLEERALTLQEYNIKIGYRAGKSNQKLKENRNSDCLSRTPDQDHRLYYPLKNVIGCEIHGESYVILK